MIPKSNTAILFSILMIVVIGKLRGIRMKDQRNSFFLIQLNFSYSHPTVKSKLQKRNPFFVNELLLHVLIGGLVIFRLVQNPKRGGINFKACYHSCFKFFRMGKISLTRRSKTLHLISDMSSFQNPDMHQFREIYDKKFSFNYGNYP